MKKSTFAAVLGTTTILFSAGIALAATPAPAPAPEVKSDFTKALTEGKILFDARYRYEYVDQDGLANNADAHTVRTRLGYETGKFYNFSALLELEDVTGLGGEDYNDTINGKTTYPVVADPEDTNINRALISYTGLPQTNLSFGRQTINLDNQRFVGAVGWRQNDQTFDAIRLKNQ